MHTDFQKDCIQKAKDHLRLIPRIDHVIRWKDMPNKVAVLVSLFKASKLSIANYVEELMISPKSFGYFTRGKGPSGESWPELFVLVKPEEFQKEKEKAMANNAENVVKSKILAILNRDSVKEIGLRDETIKTELKPTKPRFVSSVLNKLAKDSQITRFVGENKKVMWKVLSYSNKEKVVPEIIFAIPEKSTVIEFPKVKVVKSEEEKKEDSLKWAWKLVLDNLKPEQIGHISEESNQVVIRVPLKGSCVDFPYKEWRNILAEAAKTFPIWCPNITNLWNSPMNWVDDQCLLSAVRMDMKKFKSEQELVEHFDSLLKLGEV